MNLHHCIWVDVAMLDKKVADFARDLACCRRPTRGLRSCQDDEGLSKTLQIVLVGKLRHEI